MDLKSASDTMGTMNKDLLNTLLATLLILAIGILSGYSLGYYRGIQNRFPEIKTVSDINPGVATLKLNGISAGMLKGQVEGQGVRIVVAPQDIRTFAAGSAFEIPVSTAVSVAPATSAIPTEAQFVASSRGKLYYTVFDPRANEIAPQNRVYFKSTEEAERAGFKKPATQP
jgi:hypothetical protein